jgi:hypothetical protein
VPLRLVQRYAGHSIPQTTLRYAQTIDADEAISAVERILGSFVLLVVLKEIVMPKANADRHQEWLEFEISLGEEIGKLLDTEDPEGMGELVENVIEKRRGEIHRQLAERVDEALLEEVHRLVEGDPKKGVRQFDERYFRIRLQLDVIMTTAGVDGRPMRRTESIEELFSRGQSHPRVSSGAMGGGSVTASDNPSNDDRSNTPNPNNPASRSAASSRSNQMNPNNSSFRSSRSGNR